MQNSVTKSKLSALAHKFKRQSPGNCGFAAVMIFAGPRQKAAVRPLAILRTGAIVKTLVDAGANAPRRCLQPS